MLYSSNSAHYWPLDWNVLYATIFIKLIKHPNLYPNHHPKLSVPISCIWNFRMTTTLVAVPCTVSSSEWMTSLLYRCISCLFPFQDVAVLERYCLASISFPIGCSATCCPDDRVATDVPSSCSDDFKRSVKTELTPVTMTYQSDIPTVLFFVLLFSFLLSTLQSNGLCEHLSFSLAVGIGFLHPLWSFLCLSPFLFLWILSYKSFDLNDKIDSTIIPFQINPFESYLILRHAVLFVSPSHNVWRASYRKLFI